MKYFSGTATYTATIELPDEAVSKGRELSIDLGVVKETAEVFLNGKPLISGLLGPVRILSE